MLTFSTMIDTSVFNDKDRYTIVVGVGHVIDNEWNDANVTEITTRP